MIKTFSSKQSSSSSKRLGEVPLDLGKLRIPLSISSSQSRDSSWFENSVSELSIRSSRVFLYLLRIAAISDFPSTPSTACLSTYFQKMVILLFQCRKEVLAYVFPKQAYVPVKQTLNIDNIVHWLSAYQSFLFELMPQIKLRFYQAADSNYQNATTDLWLQQQVWYIQLLSFFHKKNGKNGMCKVSA